MNNDNDNGWIGILALSGRLSFWHFGWDSTMLLAPDAVLLMMIRQDGPGNNVHLRSCQEGDHIRAVHVYGKNTSRISQKPSQGCEVFSQEYHSRVFCIDPVHRFGRDLFLKYFTANVCGIVGVCTVRVRAAYALWRNCVQYPLSPSTKLGAM